MIALTRSRRTTLIAGLAAVSACAGDGVGPSQRSAAKLDPASDLTTSGVVGTPITRPLLVKVTDADGRPVAGATVTFAVTRGNGSVGTRVATSDRTGQASTSWTLGTVAGANEVTASVSGLATSIKFEATAAAGPVSRIVLTPQNARILNGSDTTRVAVASTDQFGNVTSPSPSVTARDTSLITVDAFGLVHALRRGAATYLVATASGVTDSALVTVLAPGESICTGVALPVDMAVGQVITDASGDGTCVHASVSGAEYAIIPYYNSTVPGAIRQIEVKGLGLGTPGLLPSRSPSPMRLPAGAVGSTLSRDEHFELALRARERASMAPYVAGARQWFRNRMPTLGAGANAALMATAALAVGDFVQLNTNSDDYCANPKPTTGRIAAITRNAVVVADTGNPTGGFTDAEYQSIGITFDTLVNAVDTAAFGTPSDIDNNGRVILFFTKAVNALTPRGAGSVVLGYFYSRDLLPKTSTAGDCPGSNVAEMFYLMVPDPQGIASDARSKAQVISFTNGTVAHEYQHLINASRRLYVNNAGDVQEEVWLNEGLSHVAEELNFFRAAGLSPRQNIDSAALASDKVFAAYATFTANNFGRFRRYLQTTESQGPVGSSENDDDLATRGAIWDFLRYAADHQVGAGDGTVWYRLVNTRLAGIDNITHVFGSGVMDMMRDWAISVFADDYVSGLDPRFQESTWNMRSAMPFEGLSYSLSPRFLADSRTMTFLLSGGGTSYLRFAVPTGQDALLTVTSSGLPLPTNVQLSVVRLR
ncbi:MAG TPA: hypothetical protein VF159_12615 [Gemmatimonadaceae bacterium]